jgi:membrane protease YdiL (CAAX protease family)
MNDAAVTTTAHRGPGYWRIVWLLLATARKRAAGRNRQQTRLFRNRAGDGAANWSLAGFLLFVLLMAGLNALAALAVGVAVTAGERVEAQRHGQIMVDDRFVNKVARIENYARAQHWSASQRDASLTRSYRYQAHITAMFFGEDEAPTYNDLREAVPEDGKLHARRVNSPALAALPPPQSLSAMFGSIMLLFWGAMLVFQGEGMELESQRRRHPMWEFLFSHPVPASAVFLAEILSPIAANPIFYSAPLFVGLLYASVYGGGLGLAAAAVIGVPLTVAAACLGKALEIGIVLRFTPRSRGAMLGIMGWLGYSAMMLLGVAAFTIGVLVHAAADALQPLTHVPWPLLGLFLGQRADGGFSFLQGMAVCWCAAGAVIAGAVRFSVWGAELGLTGKTEITAAPRRAAARRRATFGRNALYRKELLWLLRDRNAIVQAILIPLTLASFQLFNLRYLLVHARGAWNFFCGAAILFGVYFLSVLGPKSLASEGPALWISLTWPHGLESLLKAKAWLWSMISSVIVGCILGYAALVFPIHAWKIGLVAVGWFLLARSLAEKGATLATPTTENGQAEKVPGGRRLAAQLGTFTFSIGVFTQQWNVALLGIVYAMMTSAAMWQNFRARLPYFYDRWSETLPPAPSLMHAMIAASALVEGGTVFTAAATMFAGRNSAALVHALCYGVWVVIVVLLLARFLHGRGVRQSEIWFWPQPALALPRSGWRQGLMSFRIGALAGAALGGVAFGYTVMLRHMAWTAPLITNAEAQLSSLPHARLALAVMGVLLAPVAEEYLFRGLLYRALDREWGGWRAVLGSAAFFAMYHPTLAWLPVGAMGACSAVLFKRTGRLSTAVALHMAYNAILV